MCGGGGGGVTVLGNISVSLVKFPALVGGSETDDPVDLVRTTIILTALLCVYAVPRARCLCGCGCFIMNHSGGLRRCYVCAHLYIIHSCIM